MAKEVILNFASELQYENPKRKVTKLDQEISISCSEVMQVISREFPGVSLEDIKFKLVLVFNEKEITQKFIASYEES